MPEQIFAYILHKNGNVDDTAAELIHAANAISPEASVVAVVAGSGDELQAVCDEMAKTYAEVWKIDSDALVYINAEVLRGLLVRVLPKNPVVLVPHEHFGMDLSPGLSVKLDAAYLPDVVAFEGLEGGLLKAVREEYSGMVSTHVTCDIREGAVITIRPGAFQPDESRDAGGQVLDKTDEAVDGGIPGGNRRYLEIVEAETGDVDITKSDVLVSVGRGIEDEDNLEIVFDLAKSMGADVSCSRPIVDAKWLEKARQVGTSGQTVKPKVYLACGISGSFQHMGGIKGAPFIVAINKNAKAPIFQVADVGVVADIVEFLPDLADAIGDTK
ncbi:Electron transfer flavoprotein, alpha subunit [Olavius algarvensis associated proteobacterium Delta 3]|nr:Electron transfer flavoprotein, alpha subunit [Olavius algarvensis associated proteobacterium Delta 3]CAB5117162.1 Electron transfer flavoprotein, alpha subunit [Olavius algarvensis associated proteobacterium Delta 3]